MITYKSTRKTVLKFNKKISIKALKKLKDCLEKEAEKKLFYASRNADYSGRKIIKEEDIE